MLELALLLVFEALKAVLKFSVLAVKLALLIAGVNLFGKEEDAVPSLEDYDVEANELEAVELLRRFEGLAQQANDMHSSIEWDRANEHVKGVLAFVSDETSRWRENLEQNAAFYDLGADYALVELEIIVAELRILVQQRKQGALRQDLGDADALARACYEPLAEFARAHRVALTSVTPMVQLSEFQLATWTSFVPTGIAPIFLPPDFFQRLAWWPALAHEIGHDFLAATENFDGQLRQQLGLCSETEGQEFLQVTDEGLSYDEVARVFGAWLEEMFCDVFATMMLGPAYGWTMVELFAGSTEEVTHAPVEGSNFAPHPPRHLRLLYCAHLLKEMGQAAAADEIVAAWGHGDAEDISLQSQYGEVLELPLTLMLDLSTALVSSLYTAKLDALSGHSLESLPGIDFGPHAAAETERIRLGFLAGRLPESRHPHHIISGAVMAWHDEPHREVEFLRMCRVAIVGEAEWAEPGLAPEFTQIPQAAQMTSLREAVVLSLIFGAPKSHGQAAHGFGRRRGV